ncbi:phosphodiester glycosidase family protein [Streptomyces sp. NPDC087917]|uniref:phosphodiester glycosidase family protein n=1 Tax=Streptomyces sp. NPDC087917 TaxID=3155060 RepID=UPI003419B3EB
MSIFRPLRPVLLPVLLTGFLTAPALPAHAATRPGDARAARVGAPAARGLGTGAESGLGTAESRIETGAEPGIETARTARQVAPGLRLESYDRLEGDRWLRIDELTADLGGPDGLRAEYLPAPAGGPTPLAEAAARYAPGPGRRVVAAVNGDFFDIHATGAPLGPGVRGGRLLHSASPGPGGGSAVGFGADGSGRLQRLGLDATVTLPGGAVHPLTGYNAAKPGAESASGGFAVYTADWSGATLPVLGPGPAVELRDGRVTAVAVTPRRPATGTTLLVARGPAQRAALAALKVGDRVGVTARPRPLTGPDPVTAIGGREVLVLDGAPVGHAGEPNDTSAPRTAVALSRDGRRLRLVTVDGRQRDSGGLTLTRLGALLRRLGAHQALNLDGGGSSTLLAGRAGERALRLENAPSDGRPRPVPNGLVLTAPAGSGRLTGYRVEALGGSARAFPGLGRTLTATGHDPALGPAAGRPEWTATGGRIGPEGILRADRPGPLTVRARHGDARGALHLDVLGPLTRIRPVPARIGLAESGESAGFTLTGYDAQGAAAPVEPRDLTLAYDRSRWRVAEDGRGGFTVTALTGQASGRLTATVRATGTTVELALGVGSVARPLAGFEDAAGWSGPGAAPAEGHPGPGLALSAAPDGPAAATPPRPLPVPEQARSLTLWVRGDGSGARPAVELEGADGSPATLRGPAVDWTGWRRLTLPLPVAAERPLRVTRLSVTPGSGPGRLVWDTLSALTPPTGPATPDPARPDPAVTTAAEVRSRPWRFSADPAEAGVRAAGVRPAGTELVLTGAERDPFVHGGVRFLPLDTRRRTLDGGGGLDRMRALKRALATAAREPGTGAVAVVRPYAPGRLDAKETALLELRLAEFRRATHKGAALITLGGPRFAATRSEGVPHLTAARGARTLFGVDPFPSAGRDWLAVHPG